MTTQDKLNFIREKCIAANPEIVELKFGCVIRTKKYRWESTEEIVTAVYPDEIDEVELAFREKHIKHEDITEVLGRPIRLADVCWAMFTQKSLGPGEYADLAVIYWNLRADDLEKQSEETINFLYELLQ
jgi:hypothetical protein